MSSDSAHTTYITALGMCQMMLKQKQAEKSAEAGGFLNTKDILDAIEQILSIATFSAVDKERLITELRERFTVVTGMHQTLGNDVDHIAWLPMKRASVPWRFWDRYRLYMMERIPEAAVESIDRVTNEVLERIEDPERAGAWDSRGLVMGHVQSGKTANYTGLICKAADAGYKVFIVLSGIHNSLRSQTQVRLEEGFLGYMRDVDTIAHLVGVGEMDRSLQADTITNRTQTGDFNAPAAEQFAIHPGGRPLVFVV